MRVTKYEGIGYSVAVTMLAVTNLGLFALLGYLIWLTDNLLILVALILSPYLWVRISSKPNSELDCKERNE